MLKEIHLDFLLNEYLKELEISLVLSISNKDKVIEKLIPISHSFVGIRFGYSENYNEKDCLDTFTAIIPHAVNVQKIDIYNICTDEIMKVIVSFCPHLTKLDISRSSVTSQGLKALCANPENPTRGAPCKLTHLHLLDVAVTCDDIMILLKDIPTLEELYFFRLPTALYSIHKVDIDNNILSRAKKYNLTFLDFSKYYLNNSFLLKLLTICAELCPFVKKLIVPISDQKIVDACHLYSELERFTLEDTFEKICHRVNLDNFLLLRGKTLKYLDVSRCTLSVTKIIENCPELESIRLKNIHHEQKDTKTSKVLENLNNLEIETKVDNSIIALLNATPNVKTLDLYNLDNSEFSEPTLLGNLSKFAFKAKLKHLYIENSDHLESNIVQQIILNCNSLKTFFLDNCRNISSGGVFALKEFIKTTNREIEFDIFRCNQDYDDYRSDTYESDDINFDFSDSDDYGVYPSSDSDDYIYSD